MTERQERCRRLSGMVLTLPYVGFDQATSKVVEEIHKLLAILSDVPTEGNTREILRRIRDTMIDGGHNQYRGRDTKEAVAGIFRRLVENDKVTDQDVEWVGGEFRRLKLKRAALPLFFMGG